jgi:thiol-disulfide isomerase/thioredoxin
MKKLCMLFLVLVQLSGLAQNPKTPDPIDPEAMAKSKKAIEASPDSLSFHEEYIKASGWTRNLIWQSSLYQSRFDSVLTSLKDQYKKWMKQFPNSYMVPFAIGSALYEAESPLATDYLKKVIRLNPSLADGYFKLAIDAERWGNREEAKEYMRKASVADPANPAYEFYYDMYFDEEDMNIFKEKIYALSKKFPDHERGAQGLYWLANGTKDLSEKITIYEDLLKLYPPLKFSWSESGMYGLFTSYLNSNQVDKAIQLAESLQSKQGWKNQLRFANGYAAINKMVGKGEYKSALDSIAAISKIRIYGLGNKLQLLEAEVADKSGNTKTAYENLIKTEAKEPGDVLNKTIMEYATKLGKTEGEVSKDVWLERDKNTKPATPFELGLYTSTKKAKLSDYQGKVILLTFWFPGCGPCRGEFPFFENVVKKFKGQDLAYLAINVAPVQDPYVIPFLKGTKYSFTPLRGTDDWAQKAYGVRGEPTNFLIDKKGNIVFANFRTDNENEKTLELMIQALLSRD